LREVVAKAAISSRGQLDRTLPGDPAAAQYHYPLPTSRRSGQHGRARWHPGNGRGSPTARPSAD
jgi:hypothetical protein